MNIPQNAPVFHQKNCKLLELQSILVTTLMADADAKERQENATEELCGHGATPLWLAAILEYDWLKAMENSMSWIVIYLDVDAYGEIGPQRVFTVKGKYWKAPFVLCTLSSEIREEENCDKTPYQFHARIDALGRPWKLRNSPKI